MTTIPPMPETGPLKLEGTAYVVAISETNREFFETILEKKFFADTAYVAFIGSNFVELTEEQNMVLHSDPWSFNLPNFLFVTYTVHENVTFEDPQ